MMKYFKSKRWAIVVTLMLVVLLAYGAGCTKQQTEKPHIVFLISKDPNNYEAHKTIPKFAEDLKREHDLNVSVILGKGERSAFEFPNLEIINEADLVVVFFRRIALRVEQLDLIKNYLKAGNPLVGIRTANHAFSVRDKNIPEGYEDWWEFVPEILGCKNRGYGPVEPGTDVAVLPKAKAHFILEGFEPAEWHSAGNVYRVAPLLDPKANILLTGNVAGTTEPIAWTRTVGESRIFYTSLGYPKDFEVPQFRNLLSNGIFWALKLEGLKGAERN